MQADGFEPKFRTVRRFGYLAGVLLICIALLGCKGIPTKSERSARRDLQAVTERFQPGGFQPALPELSASSSLSNLLTYAMLNQPRIQAAYFDWAGSVERITVERSLPDPLLTFESDITDIVTTVMPGFMQEFPGPGKLKAAANVASATSQARYFAFESSVLTTALDLKRAYYNLHYLDEKVCINREMLKLVGELNRSAHAQNAVGKGTLQDVYRAQIEEDKLAVDIANLEDSRNPMLAQFKAALGLTHEQPNPPVPTNLEFTTLNLEPDEVLATGLARNPRLKAMEAEVRMAEAEIIVAQKSKVPDFAIGLMADAKAAPTMYRPLAAMSLPIWRDKIAAQIAQAQVAQRAAAARLTSEQIMLTVDFAMKTFEYREITRNLKVLHDELIPKARNSLEIARTGYLAGEIDFFNLIDSQQTLLRFELAEVEGLARREIVLTELSLQIAGVPPEGAPVLPTQTSSKTK